MRSEQEGALDSHLCLNHEEEAAVPEVADEPADAEAANADASEQAATPAATGMALPAQRLRSPDLFCRNEPAEDAICTGSSWCDDWADRRSRCDAFGCHAARSMGPNAASK